MSLFDLHPESLEKAEDPWSVDKPRAGRDAPSEPFFIRHWLDLALTRSPAWVPFVFLLPTIGLGLWWRIGEVTWFGGGLLFGAGLLVWTLFEYVLHRWILHFPLDTLAGRVTGFLLHGHHHKRPDDPLRLVATPFMWLSTVALFAAVYILAFDNYWVLPLCGTMSGYLLYEWIHWSSHHRKPRTRWGRWMKRYHLLHHFEAHHHRFGISTPLWDLVLGTYEAPVKSERSTGDDEPQAQMASTP